MGYEHKRQKTRLPLRGLIAAQVLWVTVGRKRLTIEGSYFQRPPSPPGFLALSQGCSSFGVKANLFFIT